VNTETKSFPAFKATTFFPSNPLIFCGVAVTPKIDSVPLGSLSLNDLFHDCIRNSIYL